MSRANRLAGASLLGIAGIVLLFILGEGVTPMVPGGRPLQVTAFLVPQAGYFVLVAYLLSRGNPPGVGHDWAVLLTLVAPLLLATITSAVVEVDKEAALEPAAVTALAAIGSWIGSALAGHTAKHRRPPAENSSLSS